MTCRSSRGAAVAATAAPGEEWRARLWLAGDGFTCWVEVGSCWPALRGRHRWRGANARRRVGKADVTGSPAGSLATMAGVPAGAQRTRVVAVPAPVEVP